MDVTEFVGHLASEGRLLADAAGRAGWDAPVPPCPDWTVRDLLTHVGGVHRWASAIVRDGLDGERAAQVGSVGSGPPDAELLDWYLAGSSELVAVLRAAPPDVDCFAFLPAPSPLAFWARRQAHETAIHRADAESAAGAITAIDRELAQDGIEEMATGFARRRRRFDRPGTSLALRATDGASWLAVFGEDGVVVTPDDGPADATVSGTSSDLYLWLWNRPSAAIVRGDADVAAQWGRVRVRWS
jgi:uncharacterized protein (TIGR03083 family)